MSNKKVKEIAPEVKEVEEVGQSVQVADLVVAAKIIEVASAKGLIAPADMELVGGAYRRLSDAAGLNVVEPVEAVEAEPEKEEEKAE